MITFEITGKPQPKQRPRVYRGHAFTPKETKEYEDHIRFCFMASTCERMPVYEEGVPLVAEMTFYFEIPQSYSKRRRSSILEGIEKYVKKPDVDNLCKIVLDALQDGYAFVSDEQVVTVIGEKKYTDGEPHTEVKIYEKGEVK